MSVLDRLRLDGRRVFMTGGSRGLGREMALAMAGVGADITLTGRTADSLATVAGEIEALGRTAHTILADMADPDTCEWVCAEALEMFGPFDVLVNNIGGRRVNVPLQDMPLDQWQALVDLNLTSTFVCCKAIGGAMIDARRGRADHQHRLDQRDGRGARDRGAALRGREGRGADADAQPRRRLGEARDHGERDLPGYLRHRPEPGLGARRTPRSSTDSCATSPWASSGSPRTSAPSPSTSPRMRRAT
jgi:NAD(P)-dependent dehydrogenase (short-subunit alcohol dehydrogenase family)